MPSLADRGDRPACEGTAKKGKLVCTFQIHTLQTAPAEGIPALRTLEQGLGFVPNLAAAMAESPALITGFVDLRKTLATTGTLTGAEREIIALAVSIENNCDYCMAAHSTFALMQNASEEAVMAARAGDAPADPGLGALYRFARILVARKGHVSGEDTQALLNAGYSPSAVLELIAQVAHTTMANLAHSISHAPVDQAFAPQAWPATAA
jgi:uncharacterized peroxidase-related enzyme